MAEKRPFAGPYPPTISIDPIDDSECNLMVTGSASVEGAIIHVFLHQNDPTNIVYEDFVPVDANMQWHADLTLPNDSSGPWMVTARYQDMTTFDAHQPIQANCP